MTETTQSLSPFRVSFEFTADDSVDVQLRLASRSKIVQGWRRQFRWIVAVGLGVVLTLSGGLVSGGTVAAFGAASLFGLLLGGLCFGFGGSVHDHMLRRRVRRFVMDELKSHTELVCDMELRPEGLWSRRLGLELLFPWRDATSIVEDGQDLEIQFGTGIVVVRGRGFRTMTDRQAFLDEARRLALAAGASVRR